jgi:hypothetical protein
MQQYAKAILGFPLGKTKSSIILSMALAGSFLRSEATEPVVYTSRLPLAAGWNLVTLPLQPADASVPVVLKPIEGQYESVWTYAQGKWQGFIPSVPGVNDLSQLAAGSAFWIKMKAARELEISGSQPVNAANSNSGKDLGTGWNLVGFSSSRTVTMSDAFNSLEGHYDKAAGVGEDTWQFSLPEQATDEGMSPFRGYWVHLTRPGVWLSPGFRSRVIDRETGLAISGASVGLGGLEADQPTSPDGSFVVNGISDAPDQWLTVNAPGYQPFKMLIDTTRPGEIVAYADSAATPAGLAPTVASLTRLPAPALGEVSLPEPNSPLVSAAGGPGFPVKGRGSLGNGNSILFDVIFVIDTSGSTGRRTAYDANKDGVDDTVLEVELYACQRLMNRLKSKHVRCGVVKFARYHTKNAPAGGESDGPVLSRQTRVVQPLTDEQSLVQDALDTVAAEGALGGTHTAAGIDLALQAFMHAWPEGIEDSPPARHIVLLTDGIPTLPVEGGETQELGDRLATLAAAQRAAAANVHIHPVVIDSVEAERRLTTMPSVQAITGVPGGLTRVGLRNVHELPGKLDRMTFAGIGDVVAQDVDTGSSLIIPTALDGSFEAVLPARPGTNTWQFKFSAPDSEKSLVREVRYVVEANASVSPLKPIATADVQ